MNELGIRQVIYEPGQHGYQPREKRLDVSDGLVMPAEVDHDEYLKRIKEADENRQVFIDSAGKHHELTIMNADKVEHAIIFRPSTSFSSITKNPAWMLEGAFLAASYPNAAHVNWSSFGNYATSGMSFSDVLHNIRTGRLTRGDGSEADPYQALDSVKRLVELLERNDLLPTHFVADQEAGRLVLPMMVELPEDSVKGVALNGINGIAAGASYVKAPLMEDAASRIRRRQMGNGETGDATPANIKELKANMPHVYHGWQKYIHIAPLTLALLRDDLYKGGHLIATSGHNDLDNTGQHAVYQDMRAALQRQDVRIDLQFNAKSSQHRNLDDCIRLGKLIMEGLTEIGADDGEQRGVRLLLSDEGTWSGNTDQPRQTSAIRLLGLPGITRLAILSTGLGSRLSRLRNSDRRTA
jgi:hypothetical protein